MSEQEQDLLQWAVDNFDMGYGMEGVIGGGRDNLLHVSDLYEIPEGSTLLYFWVTPEKLTRPFCPMEVVVNWPLAQGGTELRLFKITEREVEEAAISAISSNTWNKTIPFKINLANRLPVAINEAIKTAIWRNNPGDSNDC